LIKLELKNERKMTVTVKFTNPIFLNAVWGFPDNGVR